MTGAYTTSEPDPVPAWLSSDRAISGLSKLIGDRGRATEVICDALRGGKLHGRGNPIGLFGLPSAQSKIIPAGFWRGTTVQDRQRWSWSGGYFISSFDGDTLSSFAREWESVEFDTLGIVELMDRHAPADGEKAQSIDDATAPVSPANKGRRGRRRKAEWNDWVAAVAKIAADGQISGSLTDSGLGDLINDQLSAWEIDEMPRSTAQDSIAKILERFRQEGI